MEGGRRRKRIWRRREQTGGGGGEAITGRQAVSTLEAKSDGGGSVYHFISPPVLFVRGERRKGERGGFLLLEGATLPKLGLEEESSLVWKTKVRKVVILTYQLLLPLSS